MAMIIEADCENCGERTNVFRLAEKWIAEGQTILVCPDCAERLDGSRYRWDEDNG